MLIGELSEKSGFSRDTIRYYEKLGLLKMSRKNRLPNAYKDYPAEILLRLAHIKKLKNIGFTLTEIGGVLALLERNLASCEMLKKMGREKIEQMEEKIAELEHFKNAMRREIEQCDGNCFGIRK
ncbi:MAG: MerR family transcriptional regulator [Saprospiraceae bacterium]|nr:MerR family transcriptional regulator [Saprospiraceae bacterium]